jgi:aryl-alcohol dehydrogenase-like predicted oxidoreductase
VNFYDTAYAYGDGHSEQLLAQTLRAHDGRKLYVATKVPPKNRVWPGQASTPIAEVFPYDYIIEMTARSAANLGVPRIDLQQLHVWSDAWVEDDGWKRAVTDLKAKGLIEGFGISVNRWEADNVLKALDTGLVDAVQVVYNIFDQAPEDRLFPACLAKDVAVIARVPFDEGSLTGTLTADATWPKGDWRNLYFTPANIAETLPRVDALKALVPSGSSLPDLALRFILHHRAVSTTIPGMRSLGHVDANIAASDAPPLGADVIEALRAHRWERTWQVP